MLPVIDENRYERCDVLVCGGGMAGIGAAIAAARGGASTVLVEQAGWLGGMGITGATGLHSFFNIFDAHPGAERMRVVAGIPQELVDRCCEMGGGIGHVHMERGGDFVSMLTPVEPEAFKLAAARMCLEVRKPALSAVRAKRPDGPKRRPMTIWGCRTIRSTTMSSLKRSLAPAPLRPASNPEAFPGGPGPWPSPSLRPCCAFFYKAELFRGVIAANGLTPGLRRSARHAALKFQILKFQIPTAGPKPTILQNDSTTSCRAASGLLDMYSSSKHRQFKIRWTFAGRNFGRWQGVTKEHIRGDL